MSRPDPERSTRGNRRVPLSGFQFPEKPSKDSQGIWHPSPFEKKRDTTQPKRYYSLRKYSNSLNSIENSTDFVYKMDYHLSKKTVYIKFNSTHALNWATSNTTTNIHHIITLQIGRAHV